MCEYGDAFLFAMAIALLPSLAHMSGQSLLVLNSAMTLVHVRTHTRPPTSNSLPCANHCHTLQELLGMLNSPCVDVTFPNIDQALADSAAFDKQVRVCRFVCGSVVCTRL